MDSVSNGSERRATYASNEGSSQKAWLDMYRESWDMLDDLIPRVERPRYTPAGCLSPGIGAPSASMELYKESLQMIEEVLEQEQQQRLEAMGVFVQELLLNGLARLEQYRESIGILEPVQA